MRSWLNTDPSDSAGGWERWLSLLLPGAALLLVLILWELFVKFTAIELWILPSPIKVLNAFWQARVLIWRHTVQTLVETVIGFGIAVFLGVVTATLIDLSEWFRRTVYPLLVISQTIPIIAVAPLFIIWFGYGLMPKVVVVALVCFFPITVNLAEGYRMVDRDMIRLLSGMGAGKSQIFRLVKLPGAMPFFFSGLRIAGTYSIMGAVIGEWLGASQGLGILLTRSSQSFLTDRVFATIMIIVGLSLFVCFMIDSLARVVMPWYHRGNGQT